MSLNSKAIGSLAADDIRILVSRESFDKGHEVMPTQGAAHGARAMLAAIVLGATISLALFVTAFGDIKVNFEDAVVLGAQTTSVFANVGQYPINCMDSRDAEACLAGAKARKAASSVLWLGNSQVHAVNQLNQGETNAPPILFDSLMSQGLDLVTFSQPNANLQEHYVLFEYLRKRLPLGILILPVVFDDFREEGLRDEVAVLTRDEKTSFALSETAIGRRLVDVARAVPLDQDTAGIAQTMQERAERALNAWLEKHSQVWEARPAIRGYFFVGLYRLRNALFGIKATTKRKMIPGRYRDNWAALQAILSATRRDGIDVVLYVAPLRSDVETPYDGAEYTRFKAELKTLANQHGATFSNLEALVPADQWGLKDPTGLGEEAELDFMHFKAGGHKLLAAALANLVIDASANRERRR